MIYIWLCNYIYNIFKDFFFYNILKLTTKLRGRYGDFPYNLCLHRCIAYSIINIIHHSNTFFTKDAALLIHQHYPKSTVNIIHSLCLTLYGFEKKCNDMYPSLSYHTGYFIVLKILCGLPVYHPPP